MFNLVYLAQEEGWRLDEAIIIIYTNFFSTQREYVSITLLSKRITAATRARRSDAVDLIGGIKNKEGY